MTSDWIPLKFVYDGWDGYQTSLVHAMAPLTPAQLAWRPAEQLQSVGEIAAHISSGRVSWFYKMGAPGSAELIKQTADWEQAAVARDSALIVKRLEASWRMIADTLVQWSVTDLEQTYRHAYQGKTYAVSRQWTIWRILSHDMHHGGQLAVMLGMQGIEIPELGDLGGHLTIPPLAE